MARSRGVTEGGGNSRVSLRGTLAGSNINPVSPNEGNERPGDAAILDEAKYRFKRAQEWEGDFLKLYNEDTKFANGDSDNGWQWPDNIKRDRDIVNRPCLTVNKTRMHVMLLANESRQRPPAAKIRPVGDEVSFKAAQVWEGLVRHIEYVSDAQSVYTTAKESQLEGGMAYWLIQPDYEDDRSFNQELRIAPLWVNSTYLDCDIKRVDGSDALWGFIYAEYDRREFQKLFPNVPLPPANDPGLKDINNWIRKNSVRVAEYYRINLEEEDLIYLEDDGGYTWIGLEKDIPERFREELPLYRVGDKGRDFKTRKVMNRVLQWFKIAGNEIVDRRDGSDREHPNLKGRYIPIIRMPGRERNIEGKLYRAGLVRGLKDPQRIYNYNCLSLDTPLPTPAGWTTMRDVAVGDYLIDDKGKPTKVLGISPVKVGRPCFTIKFDTGCVITADDTHLWTVEDRGAQGKRPGVRRWSTKTVTTLELDPDRHVIRATDAFDLPDVELAVPPYILGAWLGDGSSRAGIVHAGRADVVAMSAELKARWPAMGDPRWKADGTAAELPLFGLSRQLSAIGVLNKKHIPAIYHRASRQQREELLRGLMDTDGHITKNRQCVFVNTNEELINDVEQLARSLGLKVTVERKAAERRMFPSGSSYQCAESWYLRFSAPPEIKTFSLPRKASRQHGPCHTRRTKQHRIISITPVGSVPVKCVMIDAPSKLFLAGWGMIPTHNTSGEVEVVALQTKTPWIVAAEAIEGNESAWKNANKTNAAYLTYRSIADDGETQIPKPERMAPPTPAQGFLEGLRIAAAEMEMSSGQYQSQFQNPTVERTPQAVDQRQRMGELANYDFTYNEMQAVRHTAVVLIDLMPHYYDTKRVVKIKAEDGTISEIAIDPQMDEAYREEKPSGGQEETAVKVLFNPKVGKYAVEADVGPRYQTQREAAWEAFKELIKGSPEMMNIMGDLGFLAADFPMADKIAERLRRHIEATAPWLLDDSKTGPVVAKLQEAAQKAEANAAELMTQLADVRMKLRGKDELRDIEAENAKSKRLVDEAHAAKEIVELGEGHGLKKLVQQTIAELLGFDPDQIERANKDVIAEQSRENVSAGNGNGNAQT